jgi:hypothetical protein
MGRQDYRLSTLLFFLRTHFADFAGKFVNHCHILAHEDRGMMQLIEVVDNKTQVIHH